MQQNVMKYSMGSNNSSSTSSDNKLHIEIKDLRDQLAAAKESALSKSDHVKYVNQLHEVYRKEIDKAAAEKSDL